MGNLTEKDKKRIEEEERYREQVKNTLTKEKEVKPKKGKGCLIVIAIFVVLGVIGTLVNSRNDGTNTSTTTKQDTFVASVNFTGNQFVISNLDPHTCENARMQVNNDYKLDGYTLESGLTSATKSGQVTVYKVGVAQFAKKDGTRFNPYSIKPQNFYIGCGGNNELKGAYWYGTF